MRIILILCVIMMICGCGKFSTKFERIDSTEARVLDFIYEPAEAAPGDTIHVKAIFAGKELKPTDIDWTISYNVVTNKYGTIDTAFNFVSINSEPVETEFSDNTTCMEFNICIPEDIMYTSSSIPEDWISILPDEYRANIPADIQNLTKNKMLNMVDSLVKMGPDMVSLALTVNPQLKEILPVMCQLLTVKFRMYTDIRGDYRIKSDYSVRYNSYFKKVSGLNISVNNNPQIDSIGIFKVKGERENYDPAENVHQFFRLDGTSGIKDSITISKGYSYFVAVFTNDPDTTRTLEDLLNNTTHLENVYAKWFYQMDSNEIKNVSTDDYMDITGDELIEKLILPNNKVIKNFTIWAQVYDAMTNEISRPCGSSLIEGRGVFKY